MSGVGFSKPQCTCTQKPECTFVQLQAVNTGMQHSGCLKYTSSYLIKKFMPRKTVSNNIKDIRFTSMISQVTEIM